MNLKNAALLLATVAMATWFSLALAQDAPGTRHEGNQAMVVILPPDGKTGLARHAVYNFETRYVSVVEFDADGIPHVKAFKSYSTLEKLVKISAP